MVTIPPRFIPPLAMRPELAKGTYSPRGDAWLRRPKILEVHDRDGPGDVQ